ncbi:MAG: DUF1800 domain-containing protein [Chloroflexi bacterium]|nr:DUF1800 domain-containing protein [Chloroflexota bacterium]
MDRRTFVKLMTVGGVAAVAAACRPSEAQTTPALQSTAGDAVTPTVTDVPFAPPVNRSREAHVINRLTFGPTPGLVNAVNQMGAEAYIEAQLAPGSIPDTAIEELLAPFDFLNADVDDLVEAYDRSELVSTFIWTTLLRAVYSRRQLYEILVHFWSDHFSIFIADPTLSYHKPVDDREVIRAHALGSFREMLGASARSSAMLLYLDNAFSFKTRPNENYARELLELHTLGVDGAYTEQDVKEIARCFTGWTLNRVYNTRGRRAGSRFVFEPEMHDDGSKIVLGEVIPAGGGMADGEMVLDIVANHPDTARYISQKLIRRFVADAPPGGLVEQCAQVFQETGGAIRPMLRTIFSSEKFWNAPPKYRRPFEYVVAMLRLLNYTVPPQSISVPWLSRALQAMGHTPFMHPSPDGYPDTMDEWIGNQLARWNVAVAALDEDSIGFGEGINNALKENDIPQEPEAVMTFFANIALGRPMTAEESDLLLGYISDTGSGQTALLEGLALLISSPGFQYR